MSAPALMAQTNELLDLACREFDDPDAVADLNAIRARLDEPLRVAIAGKVKAGKSTLLNALVGELLAPTDTGECTKVVTWYRDGHSYQVMLHPADGSDPQQVRFRRDEGAIEIDLGSRNANDVDRLEVTWPSEGLRILTLIDTPARRLADRRRCPPAPSSFSTPTTPTPRLTLCCTLMKTHPRF